MLSALFSGIVEVDVYRGQGDRPIQERETEMKKILGLFIMTMTLFLTIQSYAGETIKTIVSILPQEYLVERIGQDKVRVTTMIPPGGNPHTYEPTPSQLKDLSEADIYFEVGSGVAFETQWMKKITALNKTMDVVNVSEGIKLIAMTEHGHEGEGDDGHHHHGGKDPHVWLSPKNAILMATHIRDALINADPANTDYYQENATELILDLSDLADKIEDKLSGLTNRTFLIFHPAWGYFAADFNLTQVAVEYSGKEPTPKQMARLIKEAKAMKAKVIFASPQFSQRSADTIAHEIKGRVVLIDPLAKDYVDNLLKAAQALSESYQ